MNLGNAPGHRCVEHGRATRTHPTGQLPAGPRADRAEVHPDLPGGQTGEDPFGPGGDGRKHVVVGQRREDDLRRLRDLAWGVAPAQAVLHEVLRVLPGSILTVNRVPRGKEPGCHVRSHVPETDEAECRGRCCGHL